MNINQRTSEVLKRIKAEHAAAEFGLTDAEKISLYNSRGAVIMTALNEGIQYWGKPLNTLIWDDRNGKRCNDVCVISTHYHDNVGKFDTEFTVSIKPDSTKLSVTCVVKSDSQWKFYKFDIDTKKWHLVSTHDIDKFKK